MSETVLVIVGPTATGKSRLAVDIAESLPTRAAEIVNADSMLIYQGMDIGTDKPSPQDRSRIPHHLIDVADIHQRASVAQFQRDARQCIAEIQRRGGLPIVVGGSALYVRAVVDHFTFPGSDEQVRSQWEAELARIGPHALHRVLAERAPQSAANIEPGNGRRIVRALEIHQLTGQHEAQLPEWSYALKGVQQFGLWCERGELDARIDARVERMWADGLVCEVQSLLQHGLRESVTASRAIGYRQVIDYLDGGVTEEQAKQQVKRATRRFFRKQLGWYRRDPRITWLSAGDPDNVEIILRHLSWGEREDAAHDD